MAQRASQYVNSRNEKQHSKFTSVGLRDTEEACEVSEASSARKSFTEADPVLQPGRRERLTHTGIAKHSFAPPRTESPSSWRRETGDVTVAPRRVSVATTGNQEEMSLHEMLANDLAAWSYRMHVAIYQDTPLGTPPPQVPWKNPSNNEESQERTQEQWSPPQRESEFPRDLESESPTPSSDPSLRREDEQHVSIPAQPSPELLPRQSLKAPPEDRQQPEATSKTSLDSSLEQVPETRAEKFPLRLHRILEDLAARKGGKQIASFLPHGRAFCVYKPQEFEAIMKDYFHMTLFSSFQRQLLLYKFERIKHGQDKGAYFHELFQKGHPMMSTYMRPMKTLRRTHPKKKEAISASTSADDGSGSFLV